MKNLTRIIGLLALLGLFLMSAFVSNAQTIGTKKNITVKLTSYECGDYCDIEFKDIASGVRYTLDNVDEKTRDNDIIQDIQDLYYQYGESDKKLVGRKYKLNIEYRKTDIWKNTSTEEPPIKTGRKKTQWMINSISK